MTSDIHELIKKAGIIRRRIIEMLAPGESHHIGCSLSIVDILTVLYFKVLVTNPDNPKDPLRDIFILSKGHAAAALYATLATAGYFDVQVLMEYDRDGGTLPEHTTNAIPGIEFSAGSLGHGLPAGIGFALHMRTNRIERKTVVLLSDGELDEGSNWEAILYAGAHDLSQLTVIIDYNKLQGYGSTDDVNTLEPLKDKFRAFNWDVVEVDGHDMATLTSVLPTLEKLKTAHPKMVIAHTTKGKDIPFFEGKFESHYTSVDEDTKASIIRSLPQDL